MEKIDLKVEGSKAAADVGDKLVALVKATRKALADGFQPGTDIPVIVLEAYRDLSSVIRDMPTLQADAAEDKFPVIRALSNKSIDLAEELMKPAAT